MPKKKAPKKTKATEAAGRSKKEIKQIKSFLEKNGWQTTISKFKISPKELSAIRDGRDYEPPKGKKKSKAKAAPKKKETKKKAPRKPAKKKATKGKAKKAAPKKAEAKKSDDAPWGYKKDGTPRKRPGPGGGGKKKSTAKAAPKKKAAKRKTKKTSKRKTANLASNASIEADKLTLDYLIDQRNNGASIDDVIIALISRIRSAE